MTKTVYDVIDFVNYIRSVYDDWDVVEVLDKDDSVFPYIALAIWTCVNCVRRSVIYG